jgi:hypothetical protein
VREVIIQKNVAEKISTIINQGQNNTSAPAYVEVFVLSTGESIKLPYDPSTNIVQIKNESGKTSEIYHEVSDGNTRLRLPIDPKTGTIQGTDIKISDISIRLLPSTNKNTTYNIYSKDYKKDVKMIC